MFYKKYRKDSILEWKNSNLINKIFDPLMSFVFMVAELLLIYYAYHNLLI